jgi:predicted dehydrogenase
MQNPDSAQPSGISRRSFIKNSSVLAATAATVSFPNVLRAAEKMPLNAVVIGLGGRGAGAAANFLEALKISGAEGKIVGVADLFPEQAQRGNETFNVPADKCFSGFDAYRKVLELPDVNYCIIATPPGFRPPIFRACVDAGKNIFSEKPVAVDGPGIRAMFESAELAKQKGLKVAAGTQRRHQAAYIETIKRIHDGAIGDIVNLRAYWVNGGPIWHRGDKGSTPLERQIRNWYHYIWLCGDHICEQHVHNLDVCNWIMQTHPVRCWGMGARQQLGQKSGEIWDNFGVEYEYPNGIRLFSYCGQVKREWSSVSEAATGTKGEANPGGTIHAKDSAVWRYREKAIDPYVQEHVDLIHAIQNDTPLNEARQVTESTLTAIMGREAAYSGAGVTWDEMLANKFSYGPEKVLKDCASMQFGDFRTLQPPNPGEHNLFGEPPVVPVATA